MSLWSIAYETPVSMGFVRQEYRSRLTCPPPVDLSNPGIKPGSLRSPTLAGGFFTISAFGECKRCFLGQFFIVENRILESSVCIFSLSSDVIWGKHFNLSFRVLDS